MKKIDFVIMWVDDSDDKWIQKKTYWQEQYGIKTNQEERFRDWDTLKYLFRGIERYANWVNTVYLVTDSQIPDWLNIDHNKVIVIDHKDIISHDNLPTFNSNAIELNVHQIQGLSENFVLFNDDMFITNSVTVNDFFKGDTPRDTAAMSTISPCSDSKISRYIYNNLEIINDCFTKRDTLKSGFRKWFSPLNGLHLLRTILLIPWSKFTGFYEPHLCVSYNKSTFESVWEKFPDRLKITSSSKFREDHNLNQWVMRNWQLASNNFSSRPASFGKVMNISDNDSVLKTCKYIKNNSFKILCINDTSDVENFDLAKNNVIDAFEHIFPEKSDYEK